MTPADFHDNWKLSRLGERQAAQSHFIDLCNLLGQSKPGDPGTDEADYCFEKGATKTRGGRGWADVWKKGHFAWEHKGKGADLDATLSQLQQYALALDLHRELDAAVAAAYGWPDGMGDDEILRRLFELNQEWAEAGR